MYRNFSSDTQDHQRPLFHFNASPGAVNWEKQLKGRCFECGADNHVLFDNSALYFAICLECGCFDAVKLSCLPTEYCQEGKRKWAQYAIDEFFPHLSLTVVIEGGEG